MDLEDKRQLNETIKKVTELHTLMVQNGFAGAVKKNQENLKSFELKFDNYLKNGRKHTCYYLDAIEQRTQLQALTNKRLLAYGTLLLLGFKVLDCVPRIYNFIRSIL